MWRNISFAIPTAIPAAPLTKTLGKREEGLQVLFLLERIVVLEINGILIDILEHLRSNLVYTPSVYPHRRCPVAINRTKVTMPIN